MPNPKLTGRLYEAPRGFCKPQDTSLSGVASTRRKSNRKTKYVSLAANTLLIILSINVNRAAKRKYALKSCTRGRVLENRMMFCELNVTD